MKKDKIIYWTSTGIVSVVMGFSIINFTFFDYYPYPEGAFTHVGLPNYFKIELTVAKVLGLLALLLPNVPVKIREFAYVGFAITLFSASIAHYASGDGIMNIIDPLLFLSALIVSYRYFQKINAANVSGSKSV
ncbi:MAG: DoxX family protein [Marivirga sp.]|nr:DoxX family protein [Marivirga sp.]